MTKLLSLVLVLALSACGGGGGGDSSGVGVTPAPTPAPTPTPIPEPTPTPTSPATGLSITFNRSSLSFDYNEGAVPPSQMVLATAVGNTDKDILIGAELVGKGIQTPIAIAVDRLNRTGTVTVVPERGLAPGEYSGSIKMLACADQACSIQYGGSPYTITYSIVVRPVLVASPAALNLAATETGSSIINAIPFTSPWAAGDILATVNYLSAQTGWLTTSITDNTLQIQASAQRLSAGTYQATVMLSVPSNGQAVSIPVKLTVGTSLTVSDGASIDVDSATQVAQLQGNIPIAIASGAAASTWKASSNVPWLKLTRSTGDFSTSPAWSIDALAFRALANNTRYTAEVRIETNSSLPAKVFKLDVNKALAEIKGLDALGLLAGQSGDILVYGSGFNKLQGGLDSISIREVQPSAVAILSDKVLRLSLPAMLAGSHAIVLKSASGIATTSKSIIVTGESTYTYQALDTEGVNSTVIWDAASKSAFVVNRTLKSVMRYAVVDGIFKLVTTRSFSALDSIAMAPDHNALVVQAGYDMIYKLSPTTLATMSSLALGSSSIPAETYTQPLTIMGDNRLLQPQRGWIDLDTGLVSPALFATAGASHTAASWGIVSGDGMRLIRPDGGRTSPSGAMFHAEMLGDSKFISYNTTLAPYFYRAAASHDGHVWSLDGKVVDFDLNLLGYAKLPDDWLSNQGVMSRDGTRLYHYAQSATTGIKPRIYVFDTSKAATTEANLPVLDYFEFDDLPNCPYGPNSGAYGDCHTFESNMAISDDGKTLFIAGDRKFVVLPIPPSMAAPVIGPAPVARSGRALLPASRR